MQVRVDHRERDDRAWLRTVTLRDDGGRRIVDTVPLTFPRLRPEGPPGPPAVPTAASIVSGAGTS
jgi:hypothetical protein